LSIVSISTGWRTFLRGRSRYGNLGEPILFSKSELPKEQWFSQYVDHFNPIDIRVWKQVDKLIFNIYYVSFFMF